MNFVRLYHKGLDRETTAPVSAVSVLAESGWEPVDPAEVAGPVDENTIAQVLDRVGQDPGRAAAALEVERAGKNRSTLLDRLERIANPTTTTEGG